MLIDNLPPLPNPKVQDEMPIESGTYTYKTTLSNLLLHLFTVNGEKIVIGDPESNE